MSEKITPLALCIDIDGEVNLLTEQGEIITLFPRGSVDKVTQLTDVKTGVVVSWMFGFKENAEGFVAPHSALKLDYLESAD